VASTSTSSSDLALIYNTDEFASSDLALVYNTDEFASSDLALEDETVYSITLFLLSLQKQISPQVISPRAGKKCYDAGFAGMGFCFINHHSIIMCSY
jgi:hypothetical protein